MKPSLQLRISQQLTMTPQLQQAIRLLQLSTLDLHQEIQQALESNPLLEQDEAEQTAETDASSETDDSTVDTSEALNRDEVAQDLPVDSTWDEIYSASSAAPAPSVARDDDSDWLEPDAVAEDLRSHLLWQMELTPLSEADRAIATSLIDALDEAGYLTLSLEEILASLGRDDLEIDEIEAVRKRVQQFDPVGVASLNLTDCLQVQLAQLPPDTLWRVEAGLLLTHYLELLEKRDYRQLMRRMKISEAQLREVLQLIQSLNPRPGGLIGGKQAEYVIPDLSVRKVNGQWRVELNPDSLPRLRINQQYAALSRNARSSADSQYIRNHLQEAKWFIRSLESRNDTLLKVARCIVERQIDFFELGEEAMKPMVLADVAQEVDMHESTISRVTTQKYMNTPRGIFELKFFFSSHVATDAGGECSSTAIRALIKKLVAAENTAKPLSDNKIAELLAEQGIQVARRTIAKYRESLGIPSSSQRKRLL